MSGILSQMPPGVLTQQGISPQDQGLLALGLGLMANSGPSRMPQTFGSNFGQAGLGALQTYTHAQDHQQRTMAQQQAMAMRQQQMQMQAEEAQRAAAQQEEARRRMEAFKAQFPQLGTLAVIDPKLAAARAFPEAEKPAKPQLVTVAGPNGPVQKWVVPGSTEGVEVGAQYRPELDPSVRDAKIKDRVALEQQLDPLMRGRAAAGKTEVKVNTDNLGLKPKDRFDMEGKLRDDFRGNPVVKAADEMGSAFRLIETARNNPSPANDLAMATKYMKVLDPGSVVRESELALAMGAVGVLDKVQNYASMIISGEKLTAKQREDFYNSAKAINDTFQKERANVAGQFQKNASQYNLTPDNVVGGVPSVGEASPAKTFPAPSQKAINRLKMNPKEVALFERTFGPGSAEKYLKNK